MDSIIINKNDICCVIMKPKCDCNLCYCENTKLYSCCCFECGGCTCSEAIKVGCL